MSAEERLKNAGFKKIKNDNGDDSCLFCNYYHLNSDKTESSCTFYGVKFWEDFEASEHVCSRFDGSTIDSLFKAAAEEYSKPETSAGQKQNAQASQKEGCYIATAVYGDYNAPEVLTLRMFRDLVLKKYRIGRLFIKIYYALSPELAHKLKNNSFMNNKIKIILNKVVCWVNKKVQ